MCCFRVLRKAGMLQEKKEGEREGGNREWEGCICGTVRDKRHCCESKWRMVEGRAFI